MTQTIEEQIREMKAKASKYDELNRVVGNSLKIISNELKTLSVLFDADESTNVKVDRSPEINEMYRKLVSGEKLSYNMGEIETLLGVSKENASYIFYKLCDMEGIEKVKNQGERVKAIFHHSRMG